MLPSLRGLGWGNFSSSSSGPSAQKREPPAADDDEDLVHIVHNVTELDSALRAAAIDVFSRHAPQLTPVVHNALAEHDSYVPLMYSGTLAVLDGTRGSGLSPQLMQALMEAVKRCHFNLQPQSTSYRSYASHLVPNPRIYHVLRLRRDRSGGFGGLSGVNHGEWGVDRWLSPDTNRWADNPHLTLSRQQHPQVFENMERLANEHYRVHAGEPHQRARMG